MASKTSKDDPLLAPCLRLAIKFNCYVVLSYLSVLSCFFAVLHTFCYLFIYLLLLVVSEMLFPFYVYVVRFCFSMHSFS